MPYAITITIKDESVVENIKKELNKSGLVTSLLKEYFETQVSINPKKMTLEEVRKLRKEKEKELEAELNNTEIGELQEVEEDLIEAENKQKEKEKEKKEVRIKAFQGMIPVLFYSEDEDENIDLARMFEAERLNYESLYDWGVEKGLTPKPPEEEKK